MDKIGEQDKMNQMGQNEQNRTILDNIGQYWTIWTKWTILNNKYKIGQMEQNGQKGQNWI